MRNGQATKTKRAGEPSRAKTLPRKRRAAPTRWEPYWAAVQGKRLAKELQAPRTREWPLAHLAGEVIRYAVDAMVYASTDDGERLALALRAFECERPAAAVPSANVIDMAAWAERRARPEGGS